MPGADDKVILRIKLETEGVSKELQKLTKEIHKLTTAMGVLTKAGATGFATENKALDTGNQHLKRRAQLTREEDKRRTVASRDTSRQYDQDRKRFREQQQETQKVEGVLRRFGRGFGQGSGLGQRFATPEGGYAQRLGQLVGSAPRVLANTAMSIGGGLLGFALGGIQGAYGTHLQVGQAMGPLAGMGTRGGGSRAYLAGGARQLAGGVGGANLGYGPSATFGHAIGVGRATGDINAVYRAQQFGLAAGGMDVGEATGVMGALRSGGLRFGLGREFRGKEGSAGWKEDQAQDLALRQRSTKELEKLIASGMATGIEKTRLNQYMQSVATAVGAAGQRTTGDVNLGNIQTGFGFLARMGITDPGRAGAAAQRIDQAIMTPGGGEAGQALVMGAMGFGRPGGSTSWYDAQKRQEQGFLGEGGAKNLMDIAKFNIQQYAPQAAPGMAGNDPRLAFANVTGREMGLGNLQFMETLNKAILSGEDDVTIQKRIEEELKKREPLEKQALKATTEGFSGVMLRLAALETRAAGIGGQTAKLVEYFQDKQYELLKYLVSFLPDIMRLIKDMAVYLKIIVEGIKGATGASDLFRSMREASKDIWKKEDEKRAAEAKGKIAKEHEYIRSHPIKTTKDWLAASERQERLTKEMEGVAVPEGEEGKVFARGLGELYGRKASTTTAADIASKRGRLRAEIQRTFAPLGAAGKGKKGKKFDPFGMPLTEAVEQSLVDLEAAEGGGDAVQIGIARDALLDAYNRMKGGGKALPPREHRGPGAPSPGVYIGPKGGALNVPTPTRGRGWEDAPADVRIVLPVPIDLIGQKMGGTGAGSGVPASQPAR